MRVANSSRRKRIEFARAFTMMEIMVVVAIIGFVMATGIPTLYHALRKEGMRKAVSDVIEVCENARRRAILEQSKTAVVFYPQDRKFKVDGGGRGAPGTAMEGELPEEVSIEGLGINWITYTDARECRVFFHPNGTSDEMILILRSQNNEYCKISLELTTGLVRPIETDVTKFDQP